VGLIQLNLAPFEGDLCETLSPGSNPGLSPPAHSG